MSLMFQNIPAPGIFHKPKIYPTGVLADCARLGHITPMVPNNVQALRKVAGLTQTQLADAIGTKITMLGKLERGERPLDTDWIDKLSAALRVAPYELIAPPNLFPTDDELAEMLEVAMKELPVGATIGSYPTAVAASLRSQLLRYSGVRSSEVVATMEPSTARGEDVQPPLPTRKSARG